MRLSLIFELLLIFVLIAFAASRVIDSTESRTVGRAALRKHHAKVDYKKRQQDAVNKYCTCSTKLCNCCRDFNIPVVSLQGPGCASLQYLKGDRLAISMSFGERVLTNTTIDSRKPKPVCMPLPGGVSKFCGRVYNIKRQGEDFNACLGLELRAVQDIEASLRVSCFKFGPKGLKVEASQPLPVVVQQESNTNDEDDDDDDEDDFDFDPVDEIDDEIEEDDEIDDDDDEEEENDDDTDNDVDSVDYGAFSVFDEDFIDSFFVPSDSNNKRKKVTTAKPVPLRKVTQRPTKIPRPILKRKTTTIVPHLLNKNKVKPTFTTTTKAPQKLANNVKNKPTPKPTSSTVLITKPTKAASPETTSAAPSTTAAPLEKVSLVTTATIVSDDNPQHDDQSENVIPPHESIAAVTMMLQSLPNGNNIQHPIKDSPPPLQVPEPILISSSSMVTQTSPALLPEKNTEANSDQIIQKIITQNPVDASSQASSDEENTTQAFTEEDEEEEAAQENYIIKNDSTESLENTESTENEADYAVQSTENDDMETTTLKAEIITKKQESKDVLSDIFDGVADTLGVGSDESGDSKKGATLKDSEKDEDDDDEDDFLGDEDDDDEEEENEEDDDDSDDFESRKARLHKLKKMGKVIGGRQSRDMWLGRLHW